MGLNSVTLFHWRGDDIRDPGLLRTGSNSLTPPSRPPPATPRPPDTSHTVPHVLPADTTTDVCVARTPPPGSRTTHLPAPPTPPENQSPLRCNPPSDRTHAPRPHTAPRINISSTS